MAVDVIGYLETTGIDISYSGENVGPNDIAISCLWCDDPSTHLTIHRTKGYLNCWRCEFDDYITRHPKGWRPSFKTLIKELEKCSWSRANEIWKDIGGDSSSDEPWDINGERPELCSLPEGCYPFDSPGPFIQIRDRAFRYLKGRDFGRYHIEKYNLHFTATGYYQGRIIVPIYDNKGELVNWLGRSFLKYTKEQKDILPINLTARYLNCKLDKSKIRFAEMIYGQHNFKGEVLRIVEGAFDKMRIGDSAVALNRSQFSRRQRGIVSQLMMGVEYTSLLLDPEAEHRAQSIAEEISPFSSKIKICRLPLGSDPASLNFDAILSVESATKFSMF